MEVSDLWNVVSPRLRASITTGLSVEQVAEFCHASPKTVRRWVEGENPAEGERLIRLWHLLAFVGNDSPELDRMKPLQRFVSELFGFDVIGAPRACAILNLKQNKPSYVYQILRGGEVLKPRFHYEELVGLYGEELSVMQQLVRDQLKVTIDKAEVATLPQSEVVIPDIPAIPSNEVSTALPLQGDVSVLLASLVSAIRPVAVALLDSDDPELRNRFRELATPEGLFDVTNKLNALSSERARNQR